MLFRSIHSVKGLEFDNVFIVGMEENIMPVSRAAYDDGELEEERRLLYVAITRARKRLWLTRSRSRYLYGERSMTLPSRFIGELAKELGVEENARPSSFAGSYGGYGRGRGYGGYGGGGGYQKRPFSRPQTSEDGYYSDLPPEESAPAIGSASRFSAAAAYRANAARPAGAASGGKDYAAFRVGVRVRHPKFGDGMIVSTKGEGKDMAVNVSFPGYGIKQLSVLIAPLTIL